MILHGCTRIMRLVLMLEFQRATFRGKVPEPIKSSVSVGFSLPQTASSHCLAFHSTLTWGKESHLQKNTVLEGGFPCDNWVSFDHCRKTTEQSLEEGSKSSTCLCLWCWVAIWLHLFPLLNWLLGLNLLLVILRIISNLGRAWPAQN